MRRSPTGSVNTVSGLAGGGALKLSGAEMTINSSASHAFTGTLDGASGTLNVKSGNGSVQTIKGAGNAGYHLNVSDAGVLTLAGAAGEGGNPAQASYQGITVNGGTLNIGSADDPKTQLTLGSPFPLPPQRWTAWAIPLSPPAEILRWETGRGKSRWS